MYSVTKRISMISQPYGGYLRPSSFEHIVLKDNETLSEFENIHGSLVGTAVDYMTRFMNGTEKEDAFRVSLFGAEIIEQLNTAKDLLNGLSGLDDQSLINACKLVGYDVCFRAGTGGFKPIEEINPNKDTLNNIRIMINRGLAFFAKYGPIVESGITFEGGYTKLVSSGDADFISSDTLWDFKVSRSRLRATQTLQILMYYIMGMHSTNSAFINITKLGFYNPRSNKIRLIKTSDIPHETIELVENEIIGYNGNDLRILNEIATNRSFLLQ